jgi:hypothetical protein
VTSSREEGGAGAPSGWTEIYYFLERSNILVESGMRKSTIIVSMPTVRVSPTSVDKCDACKHPKWNSACKGGKCEFVLVTHHGSIKVFVCPFSILVICDWRLGKWHGELELNAHTIKKSKVK